MDFSNIATYIFLPITTAVIAGILVLLLWQKTHSDEPQIEITPFERKDRLGFSIKAKKNHIENIGVYWNGKLRDLYDKDDLSHERMAIVADGPPLHFTPYSATIERVSAEGSLYASISVIEDDTTHHVFDGRFRYFSPAPGTSYAPKPSGSWRTEIRVFGKNLKKQIVHRYYLTLNPVLTDAAVWYNPKLMKKSRFDVWPPY